MGIKIKKIMYYIINKCGIPFLVRNFFQRNKVTILLFHDLKTDSAAKVLKFVKDKYNIIKLDTFINAIKNQTASEIPEKAVIITFDDGHFNNYNLLPIIKEESIPITLFLCSSIVGTRRKFWFKNEEIFDIKSKLKKVSNRNRLNILSQKKVPQKKEYRSPQALTLKQINEMKYFVDFQSHTRYHPILPMCNYEEAQDEISNSKKELEDTLNIEISSISYPNGDYSERDILLAKESGYKCGVTVDSGYNTSKTDLFKLKRLSLNDTGDLNELSIRACGLIGFFKPRSGLHENPKK